MLVIRNPEHFMEVFKAVIEKDEETEYKHQLLRKFIRALVYTDEFMDGDDKNPPKNIAELFTDFAHWSFIIKIRKDAHSPDKFTMGMIFHNGAGMNDGSFSVDLTAPNGPHWTFHS